MAKYEKFAWDVRTASDASKTGSMRAAAWAELEAGASRALSQQLGAAVCHNKGGHLIHFVRDLLKH